ncbi:hypothetical protein AB0C52_13125 [Streptomyces sp. NPDC048717]|uniref:hypothetical protein n=1 Tax=Streptomyces sp. NPDC048717 TaxID=3154928 RepID=UPI0034409AFA
MTTKSTTKATTATTPTEDAGISTAATQGKPLETITLSHHLNIGGTEYPPGSRIRVDSDYARRLRRQGYVARG